MPSLFGFSFFAWTLANLCASLFMTGVIWFVQIVHYPLFANVGHGEFAEYERRHADLTGYVVAPVMLFELAASFVLAYLARQTMSVTLGYVALGLVVAAWLSTFGLQVPCHNRLSQGSCPLCTSGWFAPTGSAPSHGPPAPSCCWRSCCGSRARSVPPRLWLPSRSADAPAVRDRPGPAPLSCSRAAPFER